MKDGRIDHKVAWKLLTCGWLICTHHCVAQTTTLSPTKANAAKVDHAERSLAAIDLAVIAAESGIMDVSFEAMRRAVGKGPPVSSVDLGGLLGSQQQTRSSRSAQAAAQEAASAQVILAKRLVRLHNAWADGDVDPMRAYVAWKELVLPAARPNEAFPYSIEAPLNGNYSYSNIPFEIEEPKVADCGAASLVQWAQKAEMVGDLRETITGREKLPGATGTVLLLRAILAQEDSTPLSEVESLCLQFAETPKLLVDDPYAQLYFGHVWKMAKRLQRSSESHSKLVSAILNATPTYDKWPSNDWLEFLVAKNLRDAITDGDQDAFQHAATLSVSRYDRIRANNADYVASNEASMYAEAANRAFEAGHAKLGAECLRAHSRISVSGNYRGPGGLLDPSRGGVAKHLAQLPREERYELIRDLVWNMPNLGLVEAMNITPIETIPDVFHQNAVSGNKPIHQLMDPSAITISLFEWVVRDAVALGKEGDIVDRIKLLDEQGSDDAKLAQFVFDVVRGQPVDFAPFEKANDDGSRELTLAIARNRTFPLDLLVVQQALDKEGYETVADRHYKHVFKTARDARRTSHLGWLRRLKFRADERAGKMHTTHDALRHWTVSDDVRRTDILTGHVPNTVWVKRGDDRWGHEFGTQFSYLFLQYPIEGDFSVSFRSKDGFYEEGAVTYGGIAIEFLRYTNQLWLWGVGHRDQVKHDCESLLEGKFTKIHLAKTGTSMLVNVADEKEASKINLPSKSFPFLGMGSYHYRASTFDSLKIDGDVTIPRKVDMISPTLLGWSTKFSRQSLPAVKFTESDEESSGTEGKVDWRFTEGAIESVDNAQDDDAEKEKDNRSKLPHEALVQYLRPLCDGENISLEFYHKPGNYSLAPAIGRIAMLISDEQVRLHWITSDAKGGWTGVDQDNWVIDKNAEQLSPIDLKDDDWNQLSVRLDGDVVTLEINGRDVYRRRWETAAGRKLGLFHNPTQYQVRVKNAEFTGDWPESIPADLFETR